MKKYLLLLFLSIGLNLFAQDSTQYLINNKPLKLKLYGGISSQLLYLNQIDLVSLGPEIGVLFNYKSYLQFNYYSSLNTTDRIILDGKNSDIPYTLNQYGLTLGRIFQYKKAIHLVPSFKMAFYTLDYEREDNVSTLGGATFFTPSIKVQLNLTKKMRIDFGTGYRFTTNKDIFITQNQVNGLEYQLSLNFGRFAK